MPKKYYTRFKPLSLLLIGFSLLIACQQSEELEDISTTEQYVDANVANYDQDNEVVDNQYIVILKEDPNAEPQSSRELEDSDVELKEYEDVELGQENDKAYNKALERGISLLQKYGMGSNNMKQLLGASGLGFVANMNSSQASQLMGDPNVDFVEEDRVIALGMGALLKIPFIPSGGGNGISDDIVPYGVDRIGGATNFERNRAWRNRWIWIVDTGIDIRHPDLNVVTYYSKNFTEDRSYDDGHGHGTHVAGIAAAKDNGHGIVGVAAGARVVAIKVLNNKGYGTISQVAAGLEFVRRYSLRDDVVNISIGGQSRNVLNRILNAIADKGVHVVMAAGNEGLNAEETAPANCNGSNMYTVGAIDWNDAYMPYSNYGNSVDLAAPGHGILSTYKNRSYGYLSGTSMAAPHVAGVMLLTQGNYRTSGFTWAHDRYLQIISQ